jgi:hypothetical protein
MERGLIMLLHGLVFGLVSYFVMVLGLGQPRHIAENRSVLLACALSIYMVLFGHHLPTKINKQLF